MARFGCQHQDVAAPGVGKRRLRGQQTPDEQAQSECVCRRFRVGRDPIGQFHLPTGNHLGGEQIDALGHHRHHGCV